MNRFLLALSLLLCSTAIAQERTAGSTVETQMTWTTLSSQIKSVDTKTNLVNSRIDQAVVCGKQGLIYAPDAPGNVAGCLPAKSDPALTTISNTLVNIITCNKSGQIYDGTKCVASPSSTPDIITVSSILTPLNSKTSWFKAQVAQCPTGYKLIACTGVGGFGNISGNNCLANSDDTGAESCGSSTATGPHCSSAYKNTATSIATCLKN